jgi:hypothetical protein
MRLVRPRFRLGTLMAVITVIATWCAFQANRARLERQVEREVVALGGRIDCSRTDWTTLQPVPPPWYLASYERAMAALFSRRYIRSVDVNEREVSKECLAHVFQLPHLESFKARGCGLSDEHLRGLGAAVHLVRFEVESADVTDGGLCGLSQLHRLRFLHVGSTQATDETLKRIADLPCLVNISLSNKTMTGSSIQNLAAAQTLKVFTARAPIGDEFLKVLATCPNLKVLALLSSRPRITDGGVSHLRNHPNLTVVYVWGEQLTDASCESLEGLPNLKHANVVGWRTGFTKTLSK